MVAQRVESAEARLDAPGAWSGVQGMREMPPSVVSAGLLDAQRLLGNRAARGMLARQVVAVRPRPGVGVEGASAVVQRLALDDRQWDTVDGVTRSQAGIGGVYFVSSGSDRLVIKLASWAEQTIFAEHVLSDVMGIAVPKHVLVAKHSAEGIQIATMLAQQSGKLSSKHVKQMAGQFEDGDFFMIMESLPATSFSQLDAIQAGKAVASKAVLLQIGQLLVADAFLGHGDRIFKSSNLGNVMLSKGSDYIIAIDNEQFALSESLFAKSMILSEGIIEDWMKEEPLKKVEQKVDKEDFMVFLRPKVGDIEQFLKGLPVNFSEIPQDSVGVIKEGIRIGWKKITAWLQEQYKFTYGKDDFSKTRKEIDEQIEVSKSKLPEQSKDHVGPMQEIIKGLRENVSRSEVQAALSIVKAAFLQYEQLVVRIRQDWKTIKRAWSGHKLFWDGKVKEYAHEAQLPFDFFGKQMKYWRDFEGSLIQKQQITLLEKNCQAWLGDIGFKVSGIAKDFKSNSDVDERICEVEELIKKAKVDVGI